MHVILVFTYGISLCQMNLNFNREIELYKKMNKYEEIQYTFVTFGDKEDEKYSDLFEA